MLRLWLGSCVQLPARARATADAGVSGQPSDRGVSTRQEVPRVEGASVINLHALAGLLGADVDRLFTVTITGNPVPKGRPRFSKSGHVYTPKETEVAERAIAWTFKASQPPQLAGQVVMV